MCVCVCVCLCACLRVCVCACFCVVDECQAVGRVDAARSAVAERAAARTLSPLQVRDNRRDLIF